MFKSFGFMILCVYISLFLPGQTWDGTQAGELHGNYTPQPLQAQKNGFTFQVPSASAVILFLEPDPQ